MTPLSLSVVGHTNTGKTSLLRTLLRDTDFGDVQNAAATTRHVEQASITYQTQTLVQLYDTPGLEDASGVLDWLETHTTPQQDGIDRINQFLASHEAQTEFSQEAKVLRQLIASDTALYVIDAREPVLPKYKDELSILSWCAKPIMPVFNFTYGNDLTEWQTMLARRNLHISSSFDTVAFDFEGEMRLWHKLMTMLPENQTITPLIAMRQNEWQKLETQAYQLIADFLLDVAAFAQPCETTMLPETVQHKMHECVRQHERTMQQQICALYRFYHDDISGSHEATWQSFAQDPFDSEWLKVYGVRTSKGIAAGALIGLSVDALTLGASLGLGAAAGGLLGSIASNWNTLRDKINGVKIMRIDAPTLTVLAARSLDLLHVLQTRGHAAQQPIIVHQHIAPWHTDALPEPLLRARHYPNWSAIMYDNTAILPAKQRASVVLQRCLREASAMRVGDTVV